MWFKNGKFLSVTDIAPWVAAGKNAFETTYDVNTTTSSGTGTVPEDEEMDLMLVNFNENELISGKAVAVDPSMDTVTVSRKKWVGTETTLLRATCNKAGTLKGSFYFMVGDEAKPKKVRGKFTGIVMGGSGYGTVFLKDTGSWAVRISACGSCSD